MARAITVYEANDGSRWDEPEKAEARDALIHEVEAFQGFLVPAPPDIEFSNGHGFVQQSRGARDRVLAFLEEKGATRDSTGPIGKLLYRLHCIDDHDRQWGQPYYALNPDKAKSQREVSVR